MAINIDLWRDDQGRLDGANPLGAVDWQLPAANYMPAKFPMTIVAPRSGQAADYRYYKNYTGIKYRVPVLVHGGAWPFNYSLTNAPDGMTLGENYGDTDYGIIEWPNPTAGDHTVAILVTDQEGTTASVSYTLTVGTSGFIFLDAVSGNDSTGDGSIGNPFQTIGAWYETKTDTTYSGQHVIYRAGTYRTDVAPIEGSVRMACVSNNKPTVHYAYPDESVFIDVQNSHWIYYGGNTNVFHGGFTQQGINVSSGYKGLVVGSSETNQQVFECSFSAPLVAGVGGQNPSHIFTSREFGNGTKADTYVGISHCAFTGGDNYMLYLNYQAGIGVIEANIINNVQSSNGFYLKEDSHRFSIRANEGANNNGKLVQFDYNTPTDIEIAYNNYESTGVAVESGPTSGAVSDIFMYRNTWRTPNFIASNGSSGTITQERDVVIHSGSFGTAWQEVSNNVTISQTDNLIATSGVVDANGDLAGSDRTNYLGARGYEVSA